ncbi:glycosyl transferase family 1 [Salinimicrobium marinum]|uniref:Glycosyl transferase family 1 n=1 Tax=Salinimicrobium marinum TaxID=680283 RepID=A0A918W2T8_9FLAO|nr:glycosyltransferase [Salinimicrobium marinum]GHA50517.1 glycosyl transferase family 1 [Salinimicrobium marinum]
MEKVLIITYYWPPAGGPGVQRWLKFTKYLKDFNIDPVVYVPENPHYPLLDPSLEEEVPKHVEVVKNRIFEPYSLAKIFSKKETQQISSGIISEEENQNLIEKAMLFIRGNFFIPDARKFWIKPSIKFLTEYLQDNEIKTIITTGPPHSMHLIGLGLKEELNIKWIADFRDPWTTIGYHEKLKLTENSQLEHKELERRVLHKADHLITTSFTTRSEFREMTTTPVTVVTNGYDLETVPKPEMDRKFTVSHIGSLLSGRNPQNLWKAMAELIAENAAFSEDFQLRLTGSVGEQVLETIRKAGLSEHLELNGYVSHRQALKLQRSSQMLLLIEIDSEETKGIIPGKIFEYMVSQRPILAVGPSGADIKRIITETNTGKFFEYSEKEQIKTYLLTSYEAFRENNLTVHPIGLQKYSRKALTGELAKLL